MKRISKVLGVLVALGIMLSFAGCSSQEELKLVNAIIKSADIQTMTSDSKTIFKINMTGVDIPEENKQILEMINNISISSTTKSDVKNSKIVAEGAINLFGMKVAEGNLYVDNNKVWLKLPDNLKYIELVPSVTDFNDTLSEAQMLQIQQNAKDLTIKFLKDYSGEYNFAFANLKGQGTKVVNTPEGEKNVSLIQVKIDNDEFLKLIEYTLKNASASNSFKEYFKSLISIVSMIDTEQGTSSLDYQKDIDKAFEEFGNNTDLKEIIKEISKYVEIGKDGIDITYGMDDQDNIVSTESKLDFIIKNPEIVEQRIEIELINSSINYNLNKTNVKFPQFTKDNTIKFEDYARTNPFLKNLPFDNSEGFDIIENNDSKEISLIIGENRAMVGMNSIEMDIEPYIEGEYTMVPVKFIGDALGAEVNWNGDTNQVSYNDGQCSVIMEIGSKIAFVNGETIEIPTAPVIKNGRTMVPVRFISEQFGAYVDWNEEFQMVNIYK